MASVVIIYATTSGNTELVVDKIGEVLSTAGNKVSKKRASQAFPSDMLSADICILACPTYGQGVLHEYFEPFVTAMKKINLKGQKCAIVGLGDVRYHIDYHVESVPILQKAIESSGGKLLLPPLMISGSPIKHLDGLVKVWAQNFTKTLGK